MNRAKRVFYAVFSWPALGPILASILVCLLVALVVDNTTSRIAAQNSLATARTLATHRITILTRRIDHLSHQLAHASKDRGQLVAKIEALTSQLRQLGVTPVVTVASHAPQPTTVKPTPTRTTRVIVRPTVTATRTKTAKPTPTPHPVKSVLCGLLNCP